MDDAELRQAIYMSLAETGRAPTVHTVGDWFGDLSAAEAALGRLRLAHAIVLDSGGEIRMAPPFSAVETPHRVESAVGTWWANCAWDALAIPILLAVDATIRSWWSDAEEKLNLQVRNGSLSSTAGWVHFQIPAARWWDDIVET